MELKIGSLTIERFRALRKLKVEGLGRVNLFTGRNNTGKSSLLEALRILASDASPTVILSILRFREEDGGEMEELQQPLDAEGFFSLSSLFHGFPKFSSDVEPIIISSNGGMRSMRLSLGLGSVPDERVPDGFRRFLQQQELFDDVNTRPALIVSKG
ncbi:MAG: AAA family ATPase, partial [Candidatus Hydrogenedens sp.]|nr:AAA family ATPase [Candidatus Hydrogenedens sp.]